MTTTIPWVLNPDGTPGEAWNPTTGCTMGCPWCYARTLHDRRHAAGMTGYEVPFNEPRPMPDRLSAPLRRRKPTTYFVDSMGDLFDPAIPFEYIAAVFGVMAATPRHRYIVLTKRAERMEEWFGWLDEDRPDSNGYPASWYPFGIECIKYGIGVNDDMRRAIASHPRHSNRERDLNWPLPNVWIGVSVEDASHLGRLDHLRQCPAALRFVSFEPLLSAMSPNLDGIGWVIAGGATGPHARPSHPSWFRALRDQCREARVPYFFKQWGEWAPAGDGSSFAAGMRDCPEDARDEKACVIERAGTVHAPPPTNQREAEEWWWTLPNWLDDEQDPEAMVRIGRTTAGHLLDGVEYREVPPCA